MIDKFAERGLRSLAVAYQVRRQCNFYLVLLSQVHYLFLCEKDHFVLSFIPLAYVHQFYAYVVLVANCSVFLIQEVPEGRKESPGGPWHFVGLMPLFDPPRHDSAETIRRALNLGVNVKMITGILPTEWSQNDFTFYLLGSIFLSDCTFDIIISIHRTYLDRSIILPCGGLVASLHWQ